jgi:hypothetical protein
MEINLDLGLVNAQFDESGVVLDSEHNVSGVLGLTGTVDDDWIAAFDRSGPADVPWKVEDAQTLRFGPIPAREFAAVIATLRGQINSANKHVEGARHKRAMAERLEAEELAQIHRQVMETLGSTFGRRLSTIEDSSRYAA